MSQPNERELKVARRWSAIANSINSTIAMLQDFQEALQEIINENHELKKKLEAKESSAKEKKAS